MNHEMALQFDHARQEYEREIRNMSLLRRLQRERREARAEKAKAPKLQSVPA